MSTKADVVRRWRAAATATGPGVTWCLHPLGSSFGGVITTDFLIGAALDDEQMVTLFDHYGTDWTYAAEVNPEIRA